MDKSNLYASQVLAQINNHYDDEHSFNYTDMISHLKSDKIDNTVSTVATHAGYDESYDGSMIIVNYSDGSVLAVTTYGFNVYFK